MLAREYTYKFSDPAKIKVTYLASSGDTLSVKFEGIFSLRIESDDSIYVVNEDKTSVYIKPNYLYVEFSDVSNG